LGIGDWGLGIGDWGLGPNPQSPIPIPNSSFKIQINNEFLFRKNNVIKLITVKNVFKRKYI
jgi:hypothetical protein